MNTKFFAKITLTAALAVAGTSTATAESLKTQIDFPFLAAGANMTPGKYVLAREGAGHSTRFYLTNVSSRHGVILLSRIASEGKAAPNMTFRCGASGCSLASITGLNGTAYTVPGGKKSSAAGERLVTVALSPIAAD